MIKVRGQEKRQHYKDRRPPWIKLHRDLLENPDWNELDPFSAKLVVELWLLSSECEAATIELDSKSLAWRLRYSSNSVSRIDRALLELEDKGFIYTDSNVLASCQHVAIPETETEGEAERKKETDIRPSGRSLASLFDEFWSAYPKKKNKGDAFKAWGSTKKDRPDLAEILKAIKAQSVTEDWTKEGGKFIPYPATWLRAHAWDDEITEPSQADTDTSEWKRAYDAVAHSIWDAQERGEDLKRAMQVARDKWGDTPKRNGRDAVKGGIDRAMNNSRPRKKAHE